ncbi:hypothetical protein GCM10009104_09150 [Marinobacterium maritimum]|uniref:Uncharacterized protein n=1 Tax=Marinobacterium maritimum TaxID=500162 RepID=A0ABN1I3E2_9GAMM
MIFDFVGMFFPEMIYGWIAKGSFERWIIALRCPDKSPALVKRLQIIMPECVISYPGSIDLGLTKIDFDLFSGNAVL